MTFLELCQRLRQESGVPGTGPASVTGQTGFNLQLVNWIATAYEDIQNLHQYWLFLRGEYSFSTTIGKRNYTPTEAGVTDLDAWKVDEYRDVRAYSSVGVQDEQNLIYLSWDKYSPIYLFGTNRTAQARPTYFSFKPEDKSLDFFHVPDAVYTVNGQYYKQPDILSGNTDEPIFGSRYHLTIVWRALMFYGAYDAADERYSHGQNEYKKLIKRLEKSQLPKMGFGKPLA